MAPPSPGHLPTRAGGSARLQNLQGLRPRLLADEAQLGLVNFKLLALLGGFLLPPPEREQRFSLSPVEAKGELPKIGAARLSKFGLGLCDFLYLYKPKGGWGKDVKLAKVTALW